MKLDPKVSPLRLRLGLTLLEVVAILACLVVLGFVFILFSAHQISHAARINCVNNQKQIGLAFRTWALDNRDDYPMSFSRTNGGAKEDVATGSVSTVFYALRDELGTPKILRCPQDTNRNFAIDFTNLTDGNISYFVSLEAKGTSPRNPLAGDRNLTNTLGADDLVHITKSDAIGWSRALHSEKGNVLFCDGSVISYTNGNVTATAGMEPESYRLVIPRR